MVKAYWTKNVFRVSLQILINIFFIPANIQQVALEMHVSWCVVPVMSP